VESANEPVGTDSAVPFSDLVSARAVAVKKGHRKFFKVKIRNNTGEVIAGRLVLLGLKPKRFRTGLTFLGSRAVDVLLAPHALVTVSPLPFKKFIPIVVAGL
jgi:hypothetical protein